MSSQSLQGLYSWVTSGFCAKICVSAGVLGGSQSIDEGWTPGWRLVTWIPLAHSFLGLFRPLVGNYFFFSWSMCLPQVWGIKFQKLFYVLYMEFYDQSLYCRLIPVVHLLCVSSLMLVPSFYLWLNFKRKFQTFMEVTQSHFSVANLATAHLSFWTALATDCYSFWMN